MKQNLFTLLLAIVASIGTLFAESGTCGENLTWDLTDGVLTISGTGAMTSSIYRKNSYYYSDVPWWDNKNSIKSVIINNGVTKISAGAFLYCTNLTSVIIPNSVTRIGKCVFYGCNDIKSVIWNAENCSDFSSDGLYDNDYQLGPFYNSKEKITSFIIGENVMHIPAFLCYGLSELTSITIPNSVTSIGRLAFSGCTGISTPIYNAHVFAYMPTSYSGAYTIPNGIESISDRAFYQCWNLTSVEIPNSVTSIGDYAFSHCTGLTSMTIPNSVTSIGDYAFSHCTGLTSMTIPNSVTSIGESVFSGCESLTSVEIPNSVTSIGDYAFSGCESLTSVEIPNSVTSIGDYAFSHCTGLSSMTIPNSVTSIGKWAFLFVPNVDYYGNDTEAPWGAQKLNQKPAIFSVSLAKEYCSYGGSLANQYFYVTGVVSDINEVSTQYGNATYYIRDENENNPLLCYRLKYLYGENYTSTNQIKTNDKVTMLCKLQTYHAGSSDEHLEATNGYLISTSAIRSFVDVPFVYRYINSSEVAVHYAGLTDTLTNISIPEKVNLESIDYTITTIDDGAFYKCSSLKSFTIPNSIKKIGNNAFSYCTSLTSITIPENIQNIGEYTFSDCTNLQSVLWNAIDCSASHDGHKVFPIFQGCKNITSFTIDKKVKKLPDGLCYGLPISKITIPNSVISIGVSTFRKCINLTSIDVPDNVTSMGDCAFEACTNLKSLSLGTNITTFGDSAFASCSKISEIYNYRKTPAKLGKHAFVDVDYFNCTLYVLNSSVEMYKSSSSDWKDFYYIKPIGAESVTTETVQVTPTENTANIIWPSVSGAETYELVIKDKSGNIICTLVFNAQGQLISIVFHAPGRDMPQQTQTAGFSFTVTGLEEGQSYVLTITSKDNNGNTLDQKSVSFTTGDEQGIEDINVNTKAHKLLRNGQILILRGDRTYTVTGQEIK